MKQLYLLSLLALLTFNALGQTHPTKKSDFQAEADRRIVNLNKSHDGRLSMSDKVQLQLIIIRKLY